MRKYIVKVQDWVDDNLRRLCGRITPEKRLIVLLTMFLVFGIASIYIFVSAIYNIGKNEGRQIEIEHIQMLELHKRDSINQFNFDSYGREQD